MGNRKFAGAVSLVCITIAGIWITRAHDWFLELFHEAPVIEIDFQATAECPGGNLVDLKRHFDNQFVALEGGADRLVICHQDRLQTNSINAPGDIARMFPGCLDYRTGSLRLMRASSAVCSVPNKNIFVCDGQAAASSLGVAGLGSQSADVAECPLATLVKFGFQ